MTILAGFRDDRTFLKDSFFRQPFKVANVTENKTSEILELMLMTSSPGVLDNDRYVLKVEVEAGGTLELKTQSYQRLFLMNKGASQEIKVFVNEHSSFIMVAHPSVPHKGSNFLGRNIIYGKPTSTIVWGEIFTCGRKLNSEYFEFDFYQSITEIFIADNLVVRENLLLIPDKQKTNSMGQFRDYSHLASFILIDNKLDVEKIILVITEKLACAQDIEFGITKLSINGIILKILGNKGEQLFNILNGLKLDFKTELIGNVT